MDYFIGTILPWAGTFEPKGWYLCDGRALQTIQYQALYHVIGTRYGGDGRTYFNLPNLNGRVAIGGVSNTARQGGTEAVALTAAQLPAHGHSIQTNTNTNISGSNVPDSAKGPGVSRAGLSNAPLYKKNSGSADLITLHQSTLSIVGNTGTHTNLQPYLAVKYIICVEGVFPQRP